MSINAFLLSFAQPPQLAEPNKLAHNRGDCGCNTVPVRDGLGLQLSGRTAHTVENFEIKKAC